MFIQSFLLPQVWWMAFLLVVGSWSNTLTVTATAVPDDVGNHLRLGSSLFSASSSSSVAERQQAWMVSPPVQGIRSLIRQVQIEQQFSQEGDQERHLMETLNFCQVFLTSLEQDDMFTCACDTDTNTLTCTSKDICDDTAVGGTIECAVIELEMDFTNPPDKASAASFDLPTLEYVQLCVEYQGTAATRLPDICARVTVTEEEEDATTTTTMVYDTCQVEMESPPTSGTLTACQLCEVCTASNGQPGMNLDCSNLYDKAKTDGCVPNGGDDIAMATVENENAIRVVQQKSVEVTNEENNDNGINDNSSGPVWGASFWTVTGWTFLVTCIGMLV